MLAEVASGRDVDPGMHAASEWLLRRWEQGDLVREVAERLQENDKQFQARKADDKRRWYINGQGQTMVIIPGPVEFQMGSPESELGRSDSEKLHPQTITHSFAIAVTEVTVRDFLKFREEHLYEKELAPEATCPVINVSWYDAAAYCNWLSEKDGINDKDQWCYTPHKDDGYAAGMTIAPDFIKRRGYRLPTEAEWEYACRGGSTSSYCFGESESLLNEYGRNSNNSRDGATSPIGALKPHDFGLFDMNGNVYEWCQDVYRDEYTTDNTAEDLTVKDSEGRVLHGGSWDNIPRNCRSAIREVNRPGYRSSDDGFRVARTYN